MWRFFKKLKIELTYDPAIALLGIYTKDTNSDSEGLCIPIIIAAVSTIARIWREPRCQLTDEWIKKMW